MKILLYASMAAAMIHTTAPAQDVGQGRKLSPREQFEAVLADWNAALRAVDVAKEKAATPPEKKAAVSRAMPNLAEYARRMLDITEAHPADPAAWDALSWVLLFGRNAGDADASPWSTQYSRAVDLAIANYPGDLRLARVALALDNTTSPHRDRLFRAIYGQARDRTVQGTATLALAQYLVRKVYVVEGISSRAARIPFFTEAYDKEMRAADPRPIKAEAESLLTKVADEYGDIPFLRGGRFEARDRAADRTLAQVAEAKLDELYNLAVGKPAPDIEGKDLDGKPMKLSDYRGKVVVLVFWFSTCGPCLAQLPHERALVERLKDKPVALLGINCEADANAARAVVERERMTWPSWHDGDRDKGPIAERYHVRNYPTIFVLDPKGVIRAKGAFGGEKLGETVDLLLQQVGKSPEGR